MSAISGIIAQLYQTLGEICHCLARNDTRADVPDLGKWERMLAVKYRFHKPLSDTHEMQASLPAMVNRIASRADAEYLT